CARCGGILKSATVMFGQPLDPGVFDRAAAAAAYCDLFLAIGSTLTVEPASSLCAVAAEAGASPVILNPDPPPYDPAAPPLTPDPIGEAIPRITDQLLAAPGHLPPPRRGIHHRVTALSLLEQWGAPPRSADLATGLAPSVH